MNRYIASITLKDWTEVHYYLATNNLKEAQRRAKNMAKGNIRTIIRIFKVKNPADMWFLLGKRGYQIDPPEEYKDIYKLGCQLLLPE